MCRANWSCAFCVPQMNVFFFCPHIWKCCAAFSCKLKPNIKHNSQNQQNCLNFFFRDVLKTETGLRNSLAKGLRFLKSVRMRSDPNKWLLFLLVAEVMGHLVSSWSYSQLVANVYTGYILFCSHHKRTWIFHLSSANLFRKVGRKIPKCLFPSRKFQELPFHDFRDKRWLKCFCISFVGIESLRACVLWRKMFAAHFQFFCHLQVGCHQQFLMQVGGNNFSVNPQKSRKHSPLPAIGVCVC